MFTSGCGEGTLYLLTSPLLLVGLPVFSQTLRMRRWLERSRAGAASGEARDYSSILQHSVVKEYKTAPVAFCSSSIVMGPRWIGPVWGTSKPPDLLLVAAALTLIPDPEHDRIRSVECTESEDRCQHTIRLRSLHKVSSRRQLDCWTPRGCLHDPR